MGKQYVIKFCLLTVPYIITDIEILFGNFSVENILLNLNFVLLFAKKYIHDCNMTNQNIVFLSFLVLFTSKTLSQRTNLYYKSVWARTYW